MPCVLKNVMDRFDPKFFFIIALAIHVVLYWFLIFFVYLRDNGFLDSYLVDFNTVYMQATRTFLQDPRLLYSEEDFSTILVFRNLPACILYFIPFSFLPSQGNIDLVVYSFFILAWNYLTCFVIWKITQLDRWKALVKRTCFKDAWWSMGIYLLSPHHIGEYALGQTNAIAGFFIVLALYLFLDGKEHYAFSCVSFSLYFKISGLFLLLLVFLSKDMKKFVRNVFFIIMVQGPNLMMFITWPTMLSNFMTLNLLAGEEYTVIAYKGWGTGSTGTLSVFFTQNFGISSIVTTIIMIAALIPVVLYTLHRRGHALNEFDKWMLLILLFAISIPAFYTVHLLLYLGVFSSWVLIKDGTWSKLSKIALGIPTFSITFWFFFPLIPFLYMLPFFTVLKKAWVKESAKPVRNMP